MNPEHYPFTATPYMTTNKEDPLTADKSGYRRFLPVFVPHKNNVEGRKAAVERLTLLCKERDQLWAEVMFYWKRFYRDYPNQLLEIPYELHDTVERVRQQMTERPTFLDEVVSYLDKRPGARVVKAREICEEMNILNHKDVTEVLRHLKFENKNSTINGVGLRGWWIPAPWGLYKKRFPFL